MCEAMDVIAQRIENKGIWKGIQQGKLETVLSLFRDGTINAEKAADILGITANQFLAGVGMN